MTREDIDKVYSIQKQIVLLGNISALLDWDKEVNMPEQAVEARSEQLAMVKKQAHELMISKELFNAIRKAKRSDKLKNKDKTVIDRLEKDVKKARKLPAEFVEEMSRTVAKAQPAWEKAKNNNDFELFKPHLKKIIELKKQEIKYINLSGHPYNSLLDDFEEGMTVEKIKPVFDNLKIDLKNILEKIKKTKKYKKQEKRLNKKTWPMEKQKEVCQSIAEAMGLKNEFSRMDEYVHPFTTNLGLNDVRITTSYHNKDFFAAFFATVHEAGHALYELGFPEKFKYTVLHDAPSYGLHESQSRFWEEMIAKSESFWKKNLPWLKRNFPENLKGMSGQEFMKEINLVKPSFIRIFADEVTYCLHIILRFELEMDLLTDKISVDSLPSEWNKKMTELLGIKPKNDSEGVLQDVHWSMGAFGYFPTYAIGSIYASQIYKKMLKQNPKFEDDIAKGDYSKVLEWLRKKIHKHGRSMTAEEIIKKCCGQPLSSQDFVDYLNEKYSKIYDFS